MPLATAPAHRVLAAAMLFVSGAVLAQAPPAQPAEHVTAVAREGEGLYALLRRYGLPIDNCHVARFRSLNGLEPSDYLHRGNTYQLPLYRLVYDGKSIRSTIDNPSLATARSIQRYNRDRQRDGLQTRPYEKSTELWVPYGMLECRGGAADADSLDVADGPAAIAVAVANPESGTPPPAEADERPKRGYDIFGDDYREVARLDDDLRGHYFYLIAGHGGPDPGAMANVDGNTVCEDEYAYDVVLRLARHILLHGGIPYVIVRDPDDGIRDDKFLACDYDEEVWGDLEVPRDQVARLTQRTETVNALAKEARAPAGRWCIEVHVDSRHAERQTDLYFYHQRRSDLSEDMAEEMRDALRRNYKRQGRKREYEGLIRSRDLHTLRETDIPTVYIELGNIQHSFDQKRVLLPGNREALARWLVEGIVTGVTEGLE